MVVRITVTVTKTYSKVVLQVLVFCFISETVSKYTENQTSPYVKIILHLKSSLFLIVIPIQLNIDSTLYAANTKSSSAFHEQKK